MQNMSRLSLIFICVRDSLAAQLRRTFLLRRLKGAVNKVAIMCKTLLYHQRAIDGERHSTSEITMEDRERRH